MILTIVFYIFAIFLLFLIVVFSTYPVDNEDDIGSFLTWLLYLLGLSCIFALFWTIVDNHVGRKIYKTKEFNISEVEIEYPKKLGMLDSNAFFIGSSNGGNHIIVKKKIGENTAKYVRYYTSQVKIKKDLSKQGEPYAEYYHKKQHKKSMIDDPWIGLNHGSEKDFKFVVLHVPENTKLIPTEIQKLN